MIEKTRFEIGMNDSYEENKDASKSIKKLSYIKKTVLLPTNEINGIKELSPILDGQGEGDDVDEAKQLFDCEGNLEDKSKCQINCTENCEHLDGFEGNKYNKDNPKSKDLKTILDIDDALNRVHLSLKERIM